MKIKLYYVNFFLSSKIKSLILNNLYFIDFNKKNNNKEFNKIFDNKKLEIFF